MVQTNYGTKPPPADLDPAKEIGRPGQWLEAGNPHAAVVTAVHGGHTATCWS